jgi:hypothetical protein
LLNQLGSKSLPALQSVAKPIFFRALATQALQCGITNPKIIGVNHLRYTVKFSDNQLKKERKIEIPKGFITWDGNPNYIPNNILRQNILSYLKVQNKCKLPNSVEQFINMKNNDIEQFDFKKLNAALNKSPKSNITLYRGFRNLDEAQEMVYNYYLSKALNTLECCPIKHSILPGFMTTDKKEADCYSNANSVIIEFGAKSNSNMSSGPYGGEEYTDFDKIEADGVFIKAIHPGHGDFSNRSAFDTIYD